MPSSADSMTFPNSIIPLYKLNHVSLIPLGTANSQQVTNNIKQQTSSSNYQSPSTAPTSSGSVQMKQELHDSK